MTSESNEIEVLGENSDQLDLDVEEDITKQVNSSKDSFKQTEKMKVLLLLHHRTLTVAFSLANMSLTQFSTMKIYLTMQKLSSRTKHVVEIGEYFNCPKFDHNRDQ